MRLTPLNSKLYASILPQTDATSKFIKSISSNDKATTTDPSIISIIGDVFLPNSSCTTARNARSKADVSPFGKRTVKSAA